MAAGDRKWGAGDREKAAGDQNGPGTKRGRAAIF